MPLPDFNVDEQLLINCIKSPDAWAYTNTAMWGTIVGGAVIAGFGAYHENVLMVLAAFVIVCGSRIFEERYRSTGLKHWKSIIQKYEAAAKASEPDSADPGNPAEE